MAASRSELFTLLPNILSSLNAPEGLRCTGAFAMCISFGIVWCERDTNRDRGKFIKQASIPIKLSFYYIFHCVDGCIVSVYAKTAERIWEFGTEI